MMPCSFQRAVKGLYLSGSKTTPYNLHIYTLTRSHNEVLFYPRTKGVSPEPHWLVTLVVTRFPRTDKGGLRKTVNSSPTPMSESAKEQRC